AGNFITWLMFFVLGLRLGNGYSLKNKIAVPCALFFYTLAVLETYYLYSVHGNVADGATAVKATSFLYSFFLINIMFNYKSYKGFDHLNLIVYLGQIS